MLFVSANSIPQNKTLDAENLRVLVAVRFIADRVAQVFGFTRLTVLNNFREIVKTITEWLRCPDAFLLNLLLKSAIILIDSRDLDMLPTRGAEDLAQFRRNLIEPFSI